MRLFLTIIPLIFCATASIAQQAISNRPPKASGPVKIIDYGYYSENYNKDRTRIEEKGPNGQNTIWLFSPEGRLLSSEMFYEDGRPTGIRTSYSYDDKGRLASKLDYLRGTLNFTDTYTYPGERLVKKLRVFEPDKNRETEVDELDQTGNVVKATFRGMDGLQTEIYKYDEKGNPTVLITLDGTGKQLVKETYKYEFDAQGNWITQYVETALDPRFGPSQKSTVIRKISYY
jgi:YD repeat-containing protein